MICKEKNKKTENNEQNEGVYLYLYKCIKFLS